MQINLFAKKIISNEDKTLDNDILELINRRRRQILVHSCIYYRLNDSIISDQKFDAWSRELVRLQQSNPKEASTGIYSKDFETFDGSTGFDLPIADIWVLSKAEYLLDYTKREVRKDGQANKRIQSCTGN